MRQLDRARPYGQILPSGGWAAFEQDGILFDADGNEVGDTGRRRTRTPKAELEARLNEEQAREEGVPE